MPGRAGTVLLVSDDDYLRSTMRAYLEHEGLTVRSCGDAARIPELFFCGSGQAAADEPDGAPGHASGIDLLLMDVHSLGATGLRLAAALTSFEPDLPVIVISAADAGKNAWVAMGRRGWRFLSKPVILPELLELIYATLEGRKPLRLPKRASPASKNGEDEGVTPASNSDLKAALGLLKTQGTIQ